MSKAALHSPSKPPISETQVLRLLSARAPIDEILNELCNFIDFRSPGVIPTVLFPQGDGKRLRLAAGPKVPKVWNDAFDGLSVPAFASFESPMLRENPMPVADMKSDGSCAARRNLISSHGVQAAWAVPVPSGSNRFLGAMILFYPTAQRPTVRDMALIEHVKVEATIPSRNFRTAARL